MRGEVLRPDGEDAHRGGHAVLRRTGGPPATPAALTRASQVPKYERQTTIVSTSSIHEFSRVLGKSVMYLIPLKLCAGLVLARGNAAVRWQGLAPPGMGLRGNTFLHGLLFASPEPTCF